MTPTWRTSVTASERPGPEALRSGAASDDSMRDLTIAATYIPHDIVSHRTGSTSIGRTRS